MVEDLLPAFREDPEAAALAHPSSSTTRSDYIDRCPVPEWVIGAPGRVLTARPQTPSRDRCRCRVGHPSRTRSHEAWGSSSSLVVYYSMNKVRAHMASGAAREDRDIVVERIVDRFPDRVSAALTGDREALVRLLMISADLAWQSRADVSGSIAQQAEMAQQFADAVADCYSAQRPPSDELCDAGFTVADSVEALAVEVLQRRAESGEPSEAPIQHPRQPAAKEARHLARAHVAALRTASQARRTVSDADVEAAEYLYDAVVTLGRQHTSATSLLALRTTPSTPAPGAAHPSEPTTGDRTAGRPPPAPT